MICFGCVEHIGGGITGAFETDFTNQKLICMKLNAKGLAVAIADKTAADQNRSQRLSSAPRESAEFPLLWLRMHLTGEETSGRDKHSNWPPSQDQGAFDQEFAIKLLDKQLRTNPVLIW